MEDYPILLPLSSKLYIKSFGENTALSDGTALWWKPTDMLGEYKLALESIDYDICRGTDKDGNVSKEHQHFDERICEVDFAVTDPYLIQKSPYGIGNKATTDLRKYQLKNGTSFMDEYFKTEIKDPKDYQAPENMQKLFTTFKNKYQRIAKPLGNGLSKVPGKSIYFYSGDKDITSVLGQDVTTKPFTLIASKKEQDLTIKGSLFTNAMIMTAGEIHIDASASCNGNKTKYGRAGQVLQGIFYAGKGFKSIGHENLKNTEANLHKGERCNYGNLHIKGVAIGDLSEVVNHRRSELYEWFSADASKGSEKKKEIVVNGASVLVDYNPSLRGQLPPGAEEFNKALEVYRK